METLDNGIISIAVKEHGAELASLKYKGREYLWQADGEFWARHSPVLFPIVGNVWNKEFRSHGKIYPMGQHGFARDMDFELISKSGNEIWYRLASSGETLEKYPYPFVLEIGYRIGGNGCARSNGGQDNYELGSCGQDRDGLGSNEETGRDGLGNSEPGGHETDGNWVCAGSNESHNKAGGICSGGQDNGICTDSREARSIQVMWRVYNSGDKNMSFQIGAHPAFHWPMLSDKAIAEGTEAMKRELAGSTDRGYFRFGLRVHPYGGGPGKEDCAGKKDGDIRLARSVIGAGGCFDEAHGGYDTLDDGYMLHIGTSSFDSDALVYENGQVNAVTLCGEDRIPYLTLSFDTPVVGLWSSPGKNAPFVCIEPWYGRADSVGFSGDYEEKPWINCIAPGDTFSASYTIMVE